MVIVGLDGATFDIIKPLIAADKMPVLAGLMNSGCHGTLRSIRPPYTPPAWSTIMTGCNPGKHGIYYFSELTPGTYDARILNGADIRAKTVWEALSEHGARLGLLNIPWTYPPLSVNGFCVSGLDAPRFDRTMAHPPEVFQEVRDAAQVGGLSFNRAGLNNREAVWEVASRHLEVTGRIVRDIGSSHELDVFMPVFMQADHVGHAFWDYEPGMDAEQLSETLIGKTYRKLDEEVGKLLDAVAGPDTTVLVVSDHGFCRVRGTLNVNRWLESLGMLRFARRQDEGALLKAGQAVFRHLPLGWRNAFRLRFWSLSSRRRKLAQRSSTYLDWSRTRAFCTAEYGGVTLNIQGRRPQGTLAADGAADRVRGELETAAEKLLDPANGERIIGGVNTREELYHGPHVGRAPEIWLEPGDDAYYFALNWLGSFTADANRIYAPADKPMGGHHPDGVFIAAGAGIRHIGRPLDGLDLTQVAPTIAHRFGLHLSEADGRALSEVFEPGFVSADAPAVVEQETDFARTHGDYTPEEAAAVEKRLRDLGYL